MPNAKGMICAPQSEAAEAGVEILRAGGNAVDAAIACALVQTVVDPLMCGIAGFGSMGIYLPGRSEHLYVDFHSPAPRRLRISASAIVRCRSCSTTSRRLCCFIYSRENWCEACTTS